MKNVVIALFAAMFLIALFSIYGSSENIYMQSSGSGMPIRPGDSGIVVQGNGSEPAESIKTELQEGKDTTGEQKETNGLSASSDADKKDNEKSEKTYHKIINKVLRKDVGSMGEMLLAFWHGVASILIGEASVLMVISVWMKICKRHEKTKNE